jgi:hypothetical protein
MLQIVSATRAIHASSKTTSPVVPSSPAFGYSARRRFVQKKKRLSRAAFPPQRVPTTAALSALRLLRLLAEPKQFPASPSATAHWIASTRSFPIRMSASKRSNLGCSKRAASSWSLTTSACREQGLRPIAYTLRDDGTFYAGRRASDALDTWTGRETGDASRACTRQSTPVPSLCTSLSRARRADLSKKPGTSAAV